MGLGSFVMAMSQPFSVSSGLMRKVKMAAAHEGKTVKDFLIELAEARLQELERKGILPKGQ
jgi:hypothetical protein